MFQFLKKKTTLELVRSLLGLPIAPPKRASRRYRPKSGKDIATRPTDSSCLRGTSSTLKKTARLFRRAKVSYLPVTRTNHIHPRKLRRV